MPGELTFAINQPRLAGALVVTDGEVLAAMAFAFAHLKLVVEPGGAVALAALLAGKIDARGPGDRHRDQRGQRPMPPCSDALWPAECRSCRRPTRLGAD